MTKLTNERVAAMTEALNALPVAEVRMLDSADNTGSNQWITPEFLSLLTTVAVNLVTAATVIGWIDSTQAQELAKAVSAIIAAVSAISVNGLVVWKYLAGRNELQSQKIQAQYRYLEVVASERIQWAAKPAARR
jgi:hypothetical protein